MIVYFSGFGVLATLWMCIGVFIAGSKYPGYSHSRQFLSELGATGSPTQTLSPLMNNYPLGFLFFCFGLFVAQWQSTSIALAAIGYLIASHGIATLVAGYFPIDSNVSTKTPSTSHKIHGSAGIVMLLSLWVSPLLTLAAPQFSLAFKLFSIFCCAASIYFFVNMFKAKNQHRLGTLQRMSYGAQLIWLSGFSLILMASASR